jgi:hypothetical protein
MHFTSKIMVSHDIMDDNLVRGAYNHHTKVDMIFCTQCDNHAKVKLVLIETHCPKLSSYMLCALWTHADDDT